MNSINSPQIISIISSSVPYTAFETLWIPNTAKCVVLGENPRRTGNISIYQLDFNNNQNENDEKCENNKSTLKLEVRESKAFGFKCGTFGQSNEQLATGDFNGTLNIWDLEKLDKAVFCASNAHSKIINSIDGISASNGGNGAAELVTGSRDGTVKVWDPRTIKPVSEMRASKNETARGRDCWSVCFGNSYNAQNRMIAAGYENLCYLWRRSIFLSIDSDFHFFSFPFFGLVQSQFDPIQNGQIIGSIHCDFKILQSFAGKDRRNNSF